MGRLSGKVAIVTGAGRGLGKAISLVFAREGATIAVVSRTAENVGAVVAEIREAGGTAAGFACDVGDVAQVDRTCAAVIDMFGGVDILINNAHDTGTINAMVIDLSQEQLMRQIVTGPAAALRFMQQCQPSMAARGGGRIVNMASGSGINGSVNYAPYAMSKEALRALTRFAAKEWGEYGITVNNVCPLGMSEALEKAIEMGMPDIAPNPLGRYGSPELDIAPVVLFLASDESRYVTGYTYMADGGLTIDTAR